jgi:branched-chain amino acid transport system ATP-binding protein
MDLKMRFGGNVVLDGVDFEMDEPVIAGLIGPNGAGKTTLTNVIGGVHQPTGGGVLLNGERIDGLPSYEVARRGFGRTFQIPRPFERLTVLENLEVAARAMTPGLNHERFIERADEALELLTIQHLRGELARALSGGQRKLLELGRLLMLDPDIMVLDEPFAGVHPRLRRTIWSFIETMRTRGKAFLIISHDMGTIFSITERLLVLAGGRVLADGPPDEVKVDPRVIEAYLGADEDVEEARKAAAGTPRELESIVEKLEEHMEEGDDARDI